MEELFLQSVMSRAPAIALGLSSVHLSRKDSINYNIRILYMIDIYPFAVMRYHPTSIGVNQTKCSRSCSAITVCINREHLDFCSHIVGIANSALLSHHRLEELAQLYHVSTRCKADSDFIGPHSPREPVRSTRQNTRRQTWCWPSRAQ